MFQLTLSWDFDLLPLARNILLLLVLELGLPKGPALDWGKALREFRAQTGINQQSLADQLGISQPQVSRIEAGTAIPHPDTISTIRALIERPDNRSLFDGFLTTIRFNPHVACLVQPDVDTVRYVALSQGFREHPQFRQIDVGQTVRKDASRNGEALIMETLQSGIFNGEVLAIDAIWKAEIDQHINFWHGILTPIRSGAGGWFVHCEMAPLGAADFDAELKRRGKPLHVHTLDSEPRAGRAT